MSCTTTPRNVSSVHSRGLFLLASAGVYVFCTLASTIRRKLASKSKITKADELAISQVIAEV